MRDAAQAIKDGALPEPEELRGEECLLLRPLWEEVFFEDSKAFTDYYFQEKAARNLGFALRNEDAEAVAMLYLSPYDLRLRVGRGFQTETVNYIIGVGTRQEYRHRGYMDRLLRAALRHMYGRKQPFTFLMPANPHIYQPYQFTYIYDREKYSFNESAPWPELLKEEEFSVLAAYASRFLEEHYDVFIRRDGAYYRVMERELAAQQGRICLRRGEGGIEGCFLYTREEGKIHIQEALLAAGTEDSPVLALDSREPIIMARVVDVQALLSLLRTKQGEDVLEIGISDPLLPENEGLWQCRLSPWRADIRKLASGAEGQADGRSAQGGGCSLTAESLVSWIFGYRAAEECFVFSGEGRKKQEIMEKIHKIRHFEKVFINEIV